MPELRTKEPTPAGEESKEGIQKITKDQRKKYKKNQLAVVGVFTNHPNLKGIFHLIISLIILEVISVPAGEDTSRGDGKPTTNVKNTKDQISKALHYCTAPKKLDTNWGHFLCIKETNTIMS